MDTTFNKIFLQELCRITKMEIDDALVYIGKSKDNRSKFYKYKTFSLEPDIWIKPHIIEALQGTIKQWEVKAVIERENDFSWGV